MKRRRLAILLVGASIATFGTFLGCGDDDDASTPSTSDGGSDGATSGESSTSSDGQSGDGALQDAAFDALPLRGPNQLSALYQHTCAIRTGGQVICWGWNALKMSGAASGDNAPTPIAALGMTDATEVAAGADMSCALRADHTVWCWGSNNVGQLGYLDASVPEQTHIPLPVSGLNDARGIAAAYSSACAVRADKTVVCWGSNSNGELGQDAGQGSYERLVVPNLANVEVIAGSIDGMCVITTDRKVTCWGGATHTAPTVIPGISRAVSLGLARDHRCVLSEDRTVRCWGSNNAGEVGPGADAGSNQKTPAIVTGLTAPIAISAGGSNTCALEENGTVMCWGDNTNGGLGNGASQAGTFSAKPVKVVDITDAIDIASGSGFTCVRQTKGTAASCWGINSTAQLGATAPIGMSNKPVPIVGY